MATSFFGACSPEGIPREPPDGSPSAAKEVLADLRRTIRKLQSEIKERKRAEKALKDADRKKDEILAMVAHELLNALAPVPNAVEVMRRTRLDHPDSIWSRELIDRQVGHLTRLVHDLLDSSRIRLGKIELRMQVLDLAAILAEAVEMCRPAIDARGQTLAVQLPGHCSSMQGDPMRLTQVVANLLNNAAKYTEVGGTIWLVLEHRWSLDHAREEALIRVKDTGVGLAPGMLSKVFDPFVRSGRALDLAPGGLGLGLAVVRNLVELHQGTVIARSEGEGKGSEFIVRLPILPWQSRENATSLSA